MSDRKHEVARPYPPDFVSAETLAYRLDCSRSTIDAYVRDGLLPKPELVGNLPRWDFAQVVSFIRTRNEVGKEAGESAQNQDAYLKGIRRGPTT
jgi:predicted DNA-binding transcriptional regulator AlpA